jgi:hypothetical protein
MIRAEGKDSQFASCNDAPSRTVTSTFALKLYEVKGILPLGE